ncbi:GNAT family N-acetyltransferase [Oceanobacillus manasiensis]|uniref:GNAT family N-acetyltransferase n=1 Tax=Oceanobacillus manasiensis TaxID=586413 RepID=UPI0005A70C8C|nr:GNAT family N-acetyltransferase [Oceanobacillus manasiensis]
MELNTKRLKLVPCSNGALSAYFTKDYALGPHIAMYLEELKKDESSLGWGVWLVIDRQTNKIIGDMGFKGKPDLDKSVEIGYGITPTEQNKGYATEALHRIIEWAFNSNMVNTISAECLVGNTSSIKVLEKLKMQKIQEVDGMLYWKLNK